ncbi:MAG: hypothetical protein J7503_02535 [Cellulomonas iranensis]|uniref:hypothetical protein n=1 Tax=Cellulomonas iranensis TaxID=76862 RepID=UPI001B291054|nr:hypothetical protein [Cellulomonas iranensis]MBO9567677.1 hypothetical protein [Cellulomonas iranensis]
MSDHGTAPHDRADAGHRAAALKERIYVAFTALAVILTLQAHDADASPGRALGTLAVAVAATVCTVYLADLLSHVVVHARVPTAAEHGRMAATTLGAATVVGPALVSLALAAFGVYATSTGLLVATVTTVTTLTAVGLLAVRRLALSRRQRLVVMAGEVVLALVVLALGVLAHG